MVTTRQQRTPLGALYRTPLGAFGEGVAAPPVSDWTGTCQFETFTQYLTGIPPTNPADGITYYRDDAGSCGVELTKIGDVGAPYPGFWQTQFVMQYSGPVVPTPDNRAYVGWTITGDTSGASYVIGSDAPTEQCIRTLSGGRRYETQWSTSFFDPPGVDPPVPLTSYIYAIDGSAFPAGPWVIEHVSGAPLGFQTGETITITQ